MRSLYVFVFGVVGLTGCVPTFVPLIPPKLERQVGLVFSSGSNFTRVGEDLLLTLEFKNIPTREYVSVFLYRNDSKISEDSQLIDLKTATIIFRFSPALIGQYRAVVFFNGITVRQFDLEITSNG